MTLTTNSPAAKPVSSTDTDEITIRTVLVANRGEIACRVIETLRRLGIRSVAVYSDADSDARHVREADVAVRIGPASAVHSYLDIDAVIAAARATGADAVHPGYGFLSENQRFASALENAGIIFIGPPVAAIATMGDKITARDAVSRRSVPVVPGLSRPGLQDAELITAAPEIGFPVLIKPSAGGGGKGMHRVDEAAELPDALARARREAAAAFGDDTLFIEHFVDTPRHIEVQILADTHGNVIHLGERECSLQRRHQKVIEEAPSALLDATTRARIGQAACDAARSVGYTGAGTVEFIVSAHRPDEFFFMEMNTRLQVEHPVTEMVTGIDLVEQQIRVARGEQLTLTQDDVVLRGHAIEARVYAEDPAAGFLPTGGTIMALSQPDTAPGSSIRIDSAMVESLVVGSDYDPMLAKVIAYGADRSEALERLDGALAQTRVLGVVTNIDFCRHVLAQPDVRAARLDTALLDRLAATYAPPPPPPQAWALVGLARVGRRDPADVWDGAVGFRIGQHAPVISRLVAGEHHTTVTARVGSADSSRIVAQVAVELEVEVEVDVDTEPLAANDTGSSWSGQVELILAQPDQGAEATLIADGVRQKWNIVSVVGGAQPDQWWVAGPDGTHVISAEATASDTDAADAAGEIVSPMPGTVVALAAADGAEVTAGSPVVVVEAMKMEHTLTAPVDGVVTVSVAVGEKVSAGQQLAHVEKGN